MRKKIVSLVLSVIVLITLAAVYPWPSEASGIIFTVALMIDSAAVALAASAVFDGGGDGDGKN